MGPEIVCKQAQGNSGGDRGVLVNTGALIEIY